MTHIAIVESLNEPQQAAVTSDTAHTLVLAGAGSGKTRVLVHRVAWLLETGQAYPGGILAVTFTNKAAAEMRHRIETLLGRPVGGMWAGTFHNVAHRFLRQHHREAGLPEHFQIIDAEDQLRTLRRVIRNLSLDENEWPAKESAWFINARKDEGLRSPQVDPEGDLSIQTLVTIYRAYEQTCERAGLLDFAELLLRAFETLKTNEDLLHHYRERFFNVLVDEFQDTNAIQYAWLRLLVGDHNRLFVVGDDDQSIYSWRGAQVENMQRFRRDYPRHEVVRLEQNYRSTGVILQAANALIANNTARLGKNLWTNGADGDHIDLYAAYNDLEEARYCVEQIQQWHERGERYSDCAILYRVSAQSRVLEDALRQADVPYRVYGGFRFYERAEIKDALAYLRLVMFHGDDAAFERIVNLPARGIGQRSMEAIRATARREQIPLWEAAQRLVENRELSSRAVNALRGFMRLVDELNASIDESSIEDSLTAVVECCGLVEHYKKEKGERGLDRIENLAELIVAARDFAPGEGEEELPLITAFLSHAALEAGEGQAAAFEDAVQMMTLHSAKGLEFLRVFIVGMEEGLFPHQRSANDPDQIEEERRLCYVGITRAMRKLTLSYAESRRLHGSDFYPKASRFLQELPPELIAEIRLGGATPGAWRTPTEEEDALGIELGQRVVHRTFGEGVVLQLEGRGAHARVQVNFVNGGTKWLVVAYAGLEAGGNFS